METSCDHLRRLRRFGNAQRLKLARHDPRSQIRENALRIGFDAVGFCEASLGPEVRERLTQFIQAGYLRRHGMARGQIRAKKPSAMLSGPKQESVIVVGLSYAPKDDPLATTSAKQRSHFSLCPETETITTS